MAKLHYQDPPSEKEKKAMAPFLAEDEELIVLTGLGQTYLRSKAIVGILWPGMVPFAAVMIYAYMYEYNLLYAYIIGFALAVMFAISHTVRLHHANRYLLTTRRLIVKQGIFSVKITSALYDKITHIEVDQKFLDKILMHHGTVIVNTAGANNDQIVLKYIDYPVEFKNLLERMINREREHYGRSATRLVEVDGEVID